jgi:hypothetical protein
MSVRTYRTAARGAPPRIEIQNPAGTVTVEAVEGAQELEVRVEALNTAAEQLLERVEIEASPVDLDRVDGPVRVRVLVPAPQLFRSAAFAVRVATPPDAAARLRVASADVEVRGRMGRVEAKGASGDVEIGTVTGGGAIASASGNIRVRAVTDGLDVRTASGDISVGEAEGTVSLASASGNVLVAGAGRGRVQLKTMSGNAEIGVVPGLRIWLDLASVSGRMDSRLEDDGASAEGAPELSISARSMSGDIRVRRAATPPVTPAA